MKTPWNQEYKKGERRRLNERSKKYGTETGRKIEKETKGEEEKGNQKKTVSRQWEPVLSAHKSMEQDKYRNWGSPKGGD